MKSLNKLTTFFCLAVIGFFALTSCEGSEMFNVGAPDWIAAKADSIKKAQESSVVKVTPTPEKLGKEDLTTAFNTAVTDPVKIEAGKTYMIPFTNYSSCASNWNNWVIILRNSDSSYEMFLRADNWGWGTGWEGADLAKHCDPSGGQSDWDAWRAAMARAECTAMITNGGSGTVDIKVTMLGADSETYKQEYNNISGFDKDDVNLYFTVDNCQLVFGDPVEVPDAEPLTLSIDNVPSTVKKGTALEEAMASVTGKVTFVGTTVTKDITAADLSFQTIPDYEKTGKKTLVAIYNKTYKGNYAEKPVMASAEFEVVDEIASLAITKAPSTYYFYTSDAVSELKDRELTINKSEIEVTATYADGATSLVDINDLKFSKETIPATVGTQTVTLTSDNGKTVDLNIEVKESTSVKTVTGTPTTVGAADFSTAFLGELSDIIKVEVGETVSTSFTNNSAGADAWTNYVVLVCNAAGDVDGHLRADNFCWKVWEDGLPGHTRGTEADRNMDEFKAAMAGAKVTVYVTNTGFGSADVQIIMNGNNGKTYKQYYLNVLSADPNFRISVDHAQIVFE